MKIKPMSAILALSLVLVACAGGGSEKQVVQPLMEN